MSNTSSGNANGRPTKYHDDYAEQARKLCLLGATDLELADFFGVQEKTINNWKKKHPEFLQSIKRGKMVADGEVASKLYTRANGYRYDEVTYEKFDSQDGLIATSDGELKEGDLYKKKLVTKEVVPDTTAAIFWLKNRQPDKWRDKKEIDANIKREDWGNLEMDFS